MELKDYVKVKELIEGTKQGQRRMREEIIAEVSTFTYKETMKLVREMSLWDFIKLKLSKLKQ